MRERSMAAGPRGDGVGRALRADVERAGYYPELVWDVLDVALADETVRSFLVHPETIFDHDEVRRHVTVLVLTATRLIVAHADDHEPDPLSPEPYASVSTETVALHHIRSVVLSQAVTRPAQHRGGDIPRELTLGIGWGGVSRIDLEPAGCADPECEADHGYTGSTANDDVTLRRSADAEGDDAVRAAMDFTRELSAAVAAATRAGA